MAGDALEADAPNRLAPAVIAGYILVSNVLVYVVGELEEGQFVLASDAACAEVVVWLRLRLESLESRAKGVSALVALQPQQPLVVGFSELVAHAEDAETQVMVARKDLDFLALLEHYVYQRIQILWFLRFLAHLSEDGVPADSMPHFQSLLGLGAFLALVAHETDLI